MEDQPAGQRLLGIVLFAPQSCLSQLLRSFSEEEAAEVAKDPALGFKLFRQALRRFRLAVSKGVPKTTTFLGKALPPADDEDPAILIQKAYKTDPEEALEQVLRFYQRTGLQDESTKICEAVALFLGPKRLDDRFGCQGLTAMHLAAQKGAVHIIKVLLNHRASMEKADMDQRTPLHAAAIAGQLKSVQCLLEAKASAAACDKAGRRPLYYARGEEDSATCVSALLSITGLQADAPDRFGQTALFEAAVRGDANKALALLAADAEVDAQDKIGQTPLFAAVEHRRPEICQLLLEASADVQKPDDQKRCPLSIARCFPEGNSELFGEGTKVLKILQEGRRRRFRMVLRPATGEEMDQEGEEELAARFPDLLHKISAIRRDPPSDASESRQKRKKFRFVMVNKNGKKTKNGRVREARLRKMCEQVQIGWSYDMLIEAWKKPAR